MIKLYKRLFVLWVIKKLGNGDNCSTYLIPAYTGLGNFIMMTPAISKLKAEFPDGKIYLLAGNRFGTEEVLGEGEGIVDKIFILDEDSSIVNKILFFLKLRNFKISAALVPFNASPSFYRWGIALAGIPERIGHTLDAVNMAMGWTKESLTVKVPLRLNTHESDLHYDLIEPVVKHLKRDYDTHIASDPEDLLKEFGLTKNNYCVIQISAANAVRNPKTWQLEKFATLIKELSKDNIRIVLAGDKNEKPAINNFVKVNELDVTDLSGRTTVRQISTVIRYARFLICHDSGLMHIGNSHKTPLIALYGPTDYIYTMPKSETSHIIRKELSCSPCMKNFALTEKEVLEKCKIDFECMRIIEAQDVVDEIKLRFGLRIG